MVDLKKIKKLVEKNKEYFEALEYYDKTGDLPKLPKKRINLTIDPDIFMDFKKYCDKNHISMSAKIEDYMREQNKKFKI